MQSSCCTWISSPSRDGAGVVGMEEPGGPGNTDGAYSRVAQQTLVWEGKFHHLHQSDVILMCKWVKPRFESVCDLDFIVCMVTFLVIFFISSNTVQYLSWPWREHSKYQLDKSSKILQLHLKEMLFFPDIFVLLFFILSSSIFFIWKGKLLKISLYDDDILLYLSDFLISSWHIHWSIDQITLGFRSDGLCIF